MPFSLLKFGGVWAALTVSSLLAFGADRSPAPLKVLFFVGGGYHDYGKLAPHLTSKLSELANVSFVVKEGLEPLHDPKFADGFDAIVYDWCFDEAPDDVLDNALKTTADGKPTVMIHCTIHAFRRSSKVSEWETCCGMRSKVHDRFEPFTVVKLDPRDPITLMFPDKWETPGDELYQTISIQPKAHQLLKATSPQDGREHIVCWTWQYHRGLVFGTTLGHDMKTAASPDYLRLVANGLLWTCGDLGLDGKPVTGYAGTQSK
jgi:type 1 glutamine amidotransferase